MDLPLTPEQQLARTFDSVVLADRSDLARLVAMGPDFLDLLQRLSTADVSDLKPGEGRPTVLTTSKGRIVERLFLHHLGERGVLAVGGRASAPGVIEHLTRFTFAEQTGLSDATDESFQLVLIGPRAAEAVESAGLPRPEAYRSASGRVADASVDVLGQDGLSAEGFSVTGAGADLKAVRKHLESTVREIGGGVAAREIVECHRVLRGLPASGHELNEDHNPLEAGLWDAVSFDKGCYVGQEVVARLRTYDKVSRSIVGLELAPTDALPSVGSRLFHEGRNVGTLTTAVHPPGRSRPAALGYVKRAAIEPGLELTLGEPQSGTTARLVELPFPR